MHRDASMAKFLAQHRFATARCVPLAQDASYRRYWRLLDGPWPAVLMDAPPPEDVLPFVRIARHLAGLGLSVPCIRAADEQAGFLLEEDLGDSLYPQLLTEQNEAELFDAAVDALAVMHSAPPPDGLPAWNGGAMATTAVATMLDWWWPAMFSAPAPKAARRGLEAALKAMLAPLATGPAGFVHRDFFAGNLSWLPERDAVRRVGILDFQSAALGHPAYDLASLIQDARRDFSTALAERMIARYLAARPELEANTFRAALRICAAQRHLRVAGQWVRLARRDGKPHYLAHGPRTWALLQAALPGPETAPLASWLAHWIAPEYRANPPEQIA
ncbi:MAG: aminoglycoside phosphotransferase [Acetobacteraceae bacterium]|nr:aminoglycoside phosphotransferase [Acetobacteraceae bacterium]MSP29130.1 aminoglycoside phosphotransferase [Acetobacteraceae bacterium]